MKTLKIKTELDKKALLNALGRGYRETVIAHNEGFKNPTRAHKSKKDYNRNPKHKGNRYQYD